MVPICAKACGGLVKLFTCIDALGPVDTGGGQAPSSFPNGRTSFRKQRGAVRRNSIWADDHVVTDVSHLRIGV